MAVDFLFNGWGTTLPATAHGETIGPSLAEWLGLERVAVPLVLEGGAVSTDGEGTLIARRDDDPRRAAESRRVAGGVRDRRSVSTSGIERTIWLEHGLLEDRTGGHVDNVAAFVAPGRVLCQTVDGPRRSEPRPAGGEPRALEAAVDARGRRLEVVELDVLPYRQWAGRRLALPYLNFYLGNGCVIVPLACLPSDPEGLAQVRSVFPDREVVGVPATNLARRGGGAHCITLPLAQPA